MHRFLTALLLALVVAACTSGGDSPSPAADAGETVRRSVDEWAGTLEENEGVVYVRNPAEGLWSGSGESLLPFELEQEFGVDSTPAEAILNSIRSFAVGDDGSVYIVDGGDHRIVAFGPDGDVRWEAGRQGPGPGEMFLPGSVFVHGDRLYLVNRGGATLDEWDLEGAYVGGRSLADADLERPSYAAALPTGALALGRPLARRTGTTVTLVRLDDLATTLGAFAFDASKDPDSTGFGVSVDVRVRDGRIVLGGKGEYEFRIYDADGVLSRVVTRDVDYLRRAGTHSSEAAGSTIMGFGGVDAPVQLPGGYWLTRVVWPANVDDPDVAVYRILTEDFEVDFNSSYDLFDAEGRFLYSRLFPGNDSDDFGADLQTGPDGAVYTIVADPFPHVRRYRVRVPR